MKKYKYLLFDLDGTLIYSHDGIFHCMRYALKAMGEPISPTDAFLRRTVGPPLEYTFEFIFGMGHERALEATRQYRVEYARKGVMMNRPIEGVEALLQALSERGYVLGVATSKPQHFAEQILERIGFTKYFTHIVGCGVDGSLPTKSDVVAVAIERFGAERSECLMIGDRVYDAQGAKDNGIDVALVAVGYAEEGEFEACAPTYALKDFEELSKLLEG